MKKHQIKVNFSRKDTRRPVLIFCNNSYVGQIAASSTTTRQFRLSFNNLYFGMDRRIRPRSGGAPEIWFKTLKEAREHAIKVLEVLQV